MPFILRRVMQRNDATTYSEHLVDHQCYVPADELRRTDKVIPVHDIPEGILADLAIRYPEEFADAAGARGIGLVPGATGRLASLLTLSAKKLVAAIQDLSPRGDQELLWAIYENEMLRGDNGDGARASIIAALAAAGVGESLGDQMHDGDDTPLAEA